LELGCHLKGSPECGDTVECLGSYY
jgi:hypothetical protein